MTKKTIAAAFLSIAATFIATSSAQAQLLYAMPTPTGEYTSPDGYDFSGITGDPYSTPPTAYQNIGTFSFTSIPVVDVVSITISGSFGFPFNTTTALSDYYLGDNLGDTEEAVEVAACDSALDNCYSGEEGPYNWSLSLNGAQIRALANGLENGSIDFGYTWDQDTPPSADFFGDSYGYDLQYVYAGAATLQVAYTPEPGTVLFCFSGIAGIAALRRFRRV